MVTEGPSEFALAKGDWCAEQQFTLFVSFDHIQNLIENPLFDIVGLPSHQNIFLLAFLSTFWHPC